VEYLHVHIRISQESKRFVEDLARKLLYENSIEYRKVFRKICEELGYVV